MTESELMEYEQLCTQILARYTDSHGMVDTAIRELVRRSMLLSIENERLRTTRPEPSRLEIAATMMESMLRSGDVGGIDLTAGQCADLLGVEKYENSKHYPQICALFAFIYADALLAAAKGGE